MISPPFQNEDQISVYSPVFSSFSSFIFFFFFFLFSPFLLFFSLYFLLFEKKIILFMLVLVESITSTGRVTKLLLCATLWSVASAQLDTGGKWHINKAVIHIVDCYVVYLFSYGWLKNRVYKKYIDIYLK